MKKGPVRIVLNSLNIMICSFLRTSEITDNVHIGPIDTIDIQMTVKLFLSLSFIILIASYKNYSKILTMLSTILGMKP